MAPGRYARYIRRLRLAGLVVTVVGGFAAAAVLLPHSPGGLRGLLAGVGPAAPLIALAGWVLLTPAMFPGAVLAAAGGLAFGAVAGSVLAFSGAVTGGLAAFALARTAARRPAQRFVQRRHRLARIEPVLEQHGFASVLAARLMPGVPVTGLHYAAGISPVTARSFAGAIAIGALLRTVPYAILGQGLSSGSITTILIAAGTVVLGGVTAGMLVRQIRRASATAA
ncbi:MAG TPA: VTT domain-containing protein [Solirubrobacteraceae bacterium]|nr:VTT domain-containing protein [Solirubrobacteraceae bacterium]